MPRIPTYDNFQVAPNTVPQNRFQGVQPNAQSIETPDIAGKQAQQTGQAMQQFGGAIGRIAQEMQQKADMGRVDDGMNQLVKARTDLAAEALQFNGRNALERPNGKSLADEYSEKLKTLAGEIDASLGNDNQRQAFRQQAAQVGQQLYGTLTSHMVSQQKVYRADTQKATLELAIDQAARLGQDEEIFTQSLGAIRATVFDQVMENGGNEQIAEAQYRKTADVAYYTRYKAWQQSDPVAALASFQRNQSEISPVTRDRIAGELFRASAPTLALAAQPWVMSAGSAPIDRPELANEPRGVRNNNPGNIRQSGTPWVGQAPGNDPAYVTFATPEAGIRAMGKNLLTYQDTYGLNTISSIVSRWAPASENDTASYIRTVSKAMGVKPDSALNLRDPDTMGKLIGAMIRVENGKQPYTDAQLQAGINAALGKGQMPAAMGKAPPLSAPAWRDPNATTGISVIDNLPPDQRAQVFSLAHSQVGQGMARARDALAGRVADASAEYMALGQAENPPDESEFIQAYGQLEGVQRYQAFQDIATLGQQSQRMKTLSNADLLALVENSKPVPGEGFAARARNFEVLQKAAIQTLEARSSDPVKFALQNPAFGIQPITNFTNVGAFVAELGKRKGVMDRIATDYGTAPAVLTNEEAAQFGKHLETLQVPDKARVLGHFAAASGPAGARSLSAQLKDKNNTLAVAAMLSTYTTAPTTRWFGPDTPGANVGQMYLEGKDAIEQKRAKIDQQAEYGVKAEIFKAIDGVYQTPQGRDTAAEAAFGIYGKLQADGEGDVERAVELATGGIMELNGAKVAKPYGWEDSRFRDALWNALPAQIEQSGADFLVGGQVVSAADFAKSLPGARLQTYGQGMYLVMAGNDVVRSLDGTPYLLTVGP